MAILPVHSPHCFGIFKRSMIQADYLPLCEILDSSVIAEAFEEDNIVFGIADEDVFTPAITLWAMVSQFLFKDTGRSCKAAAGRVVSLWAQTAGRVVSQNAGNFCRAKAKIPTTTIISETMIRSVRIDSMKQRESPSGLVHNVKVGCRNESIAKCPHSLKFDYVMSP